MGSGEKIKNYESMSVQEKWNVLAAVANLYYNSDLTQSQIAERLYTSRSRISRMLKEARELGIVEIHIQEPWERNLAYESRLKEAFSLKNVRVISTKDTNRDNGLSRIAEATAYYLDSIVKQGMGAASLKSPEKDGLDLAKDLASAYGGKYRYIYAPLFVKNRELKESLVQEENIKRVLELSAGADAILTSVGSIVYKSWSNYLSISTLETLESRGAVGHIGGHFYDVQGRELETSLSERMIGSTLEDIRRCPEVVCAACGESKAEAVLGALRGGFLNTLVVDERCAGRILGL